MAETIHLGKLPFQVDDGIAYRARIGIVTLATDYTIEHEFQLVTHSLPGVAVYVSRIAMDTDVSTDTLAAMEGRIAPSTELLLPGEPFDVVAYGCTSATAVLGAPRVAELIQAIKPGAAVTEPISAATTALRALGASRIGVLTPYVRAVNDRIEAVFRQAGFDVAAFGSFEEPNDPTVAAISPGSIIEAARRVAQAAPIDGFFISCTSLRAFESVATLERELGVPVTASNHAMIWHALRLSGVQETFANMGKLYEIAK